MAELDFFKFFLKEATVNYFARTNRPFNFETFKSFLVQRLSPFDLTFEVDPKDPNKVSVDCKFTLKDISMPLAKIREFNGVAEKFSKLDRDTQIKVMKKIGRFYAFVWDEEFWKYSNEAERRRKLFLLLYDHGISNPLIAEIEKECEKNGLI